MEDKTKLNHALYHLSHIKELLKSWFSMNAQPDFETPIVRLENHIERELNRIIAQDIVSYTGDIEGSSGD